MEDFPETVKGVSHVVDAIREARKARAEIKPRRRNNTCTD